MEKSKLNAETGTHMTSLSGCIGMCPFVINSGFISSSRLFYVLGAICYLETLNKIDEDSRKILKGIQLS